MRFLRVLTLSIFSLLFSVQVVSAATVLQFLPRTLDVKEGEKFTLTVQAVPNNDKNYTVRMVAEFPPELLSVYSWTYADNWLPLRKPGYDSLDNDKGILMRTGGFPEGFTSSTNFGTIIFVAKKSGTASVKLGFESMILDSENNNVVALSQPTRVNIEGVLVPVPVIAPVPIKVVPEPQKILQAGVPELVPKLDEIVPVLVAPPEPSADGSAPVSSTASSTPVVSETTSSVKQEPLVQKSQSRHLNLHIDDTLVGSASDVLAVAVLENFEYDIQDISLSYSILDKNGKSLYQNTDSLLVEEQRTKIPKFKNLNLPDGVYTLAVNVVEDDKVIDTEEKKFEVKKQVESSRRVSLVLSLSVLFLLILCLWILFRVYRENKQKSP